MKEDPKPGQAFEYRAGIVNPAGGVFPGWGGMMPDLDPGSLPTNRPALALNCRFEAGQIKSRPGLELLSIVPPPWEYTTGVASVFAENVTWMGTHHMQSKLPLLWALAWSLGNSSVYVFSPDATTAIGVASYNNDLPIPDGIGAFGGDVYATSGRRLMLLNPRQSEPVLIAGVGPGTNNLQEFGGKLWLGSAQTWDGVSLATATGAFPITSSCVWRDYFLVGVGHNESDYAYATTGDVWLTAALPGTLDNTNKNAVVEFREAVYVASGGRDIYKVIPSVSAAVAHTLPVDSKVTALATLGDYLFYAYTTDDGGNSTNYIGIHDPEGLSLQWVDQHHVLTELTGAVTSMVAYRNRLYVGTMGGVATHTLSCDATSAWYTIDGMPGGVVGLLVVGA